MNKHHRLLRTSLVLLAIAPPAIRAAEESHAHTPRAHIYHSPHFILHTDLAAREAEQALSRMEAVLTLASRYWRRAPRGRMDCYLVNDLESWPDAAWPHPLARVWVGGIGGATIGELVGGQDRPRSKATIYSAARAGIVEHEVIHAYCAQTFREMGPDWYKEGMADVVSLHDPGRRGVACSRERILLLRDGDPRTVQQIVAADRFTSRISDSLGAKLNGERPRDRHVPLSDWTQDDADELGAAEPTYAWSWALCHMLVNNPNYAERFRQLGAAYLWKRSGSFANAFSPRRKQLEFELAFFTRRIDIGYRVDLCSWDWDKPFRPLEAGAEIRVRLDAARGFQPSGLRVTAGGRYRFRADGHWTTSTHRPPTDANGTPGGEGRLIGVVMDDFRLSTPLELGSQGTFVAPASGDLYLRCQETWNQLSDNSGEILVQLSR